MAVQRPVCASSRGHHKPAEDEALVHVEGVKDAFQQALLQDLDRLAHALLRAHLRPQGVLLVHVVRVGLQAPEAKQPQERTRAVVLCSCQHCWLSHSKAACTTYIEQCNVPT